MAIHDKDLIMKRLKYIFLLLTFISLQLACRKENIDTTTVVKDDVVPETVVVNNLVSHLTAQNPDGVDLDCFKILFPFSVITIDNQTLEIQTTADFEAVTQTNGIIDFVFPMEIITNTGVQQTLHNIEEMSGQYATCVPDAGWSTDGIPAYDINTQNSCFQMIYPVNLVDINNDMVIAENSAQFADYIAGEPMFFSWPLHLAAGDSSIVTVTAPQELMDLLLSCGTTNQSLDSLEGFGAYLACFRIIFPVAIYTLNGDIENINDGNEFLSYLLPGNFLAFNYPIQLESPGGQMLNVTSDQQLDELVQLNCGAIGPEFDISFIYLLTGEGQCFNVHYPIQALNEDSMVININDYLALSDLIQSPSGLPPALLFPVTLTLIQTGEEVIVETPAELEMIINDCN